MVCEIIIFCECQHIFEKIYKLEYSALGIHKKCDMIFFLFLTAYYFARLYNTYKRDHH